jgi:hypothetical protein
LVATSWDDLVKGNLRHALDLDENGVQPPAGATAGSHAVWTDTRDDGSIFEGGDTCGEWTDPTPAGSATGQWDRQQYWSLSCSGCGCNGTASLYCFEQ